MAIRNLNRKSAFGIEYTYTIDNFDTESLDIPANTTFLSKDLGKIFYKDNYSNVIGVFDGEYLYTEVQPAPADIRTLPGQIYELMAAPGDNKYIEVHRIITESYPGESPQTDPYNYGSAKAVYFSHASSLITSNYIGLIGLGDAVLWMGNSKSYAVVNPYGSEVVDLSINKPLYVSIDGGTFPGSNATQGTHLVTFRIWYRIRSIITS